MAHRKGRSLLTGAGIVLGIAILFGVLVSNATTQAGVDLLFEDFTGKSDVVAGPVGVFGAKLPNDAIPKLRELPRVREVVGDFGFGTVLPDDLRPDGEDGEDDGIFVNGIVPDEAKKIQNFEFASGRFAADGTDEIVVSQRLIDETDLEMGATIDVKAKAQERKLRVVGVLEEKGAGRAGEGRGAYASLPVVRAMAGEPAGTFHGAAIILADDTSVDDWIDDHRGSVEGVRLQNTENIAQGFREFLNVFGTFLTFFAAITLFVGAFLIYLTLSMAVIERTRMYGTLRALGATRRQVRRVVLTEAIALGVVSIVAGLLLGLALALGLLQLIGSLFDLDLPGLVVTPGAVIGAVVVGLVVTLVSALIPAVRAGRLAPVEAMKGDYARDTRLGRAWIFGAVLLAVCIAVRLAGAVPNDSIGSMTVIGILFGGVLVTPVLLRPLARVLGQVTNRIARGVGEIAVLHLSKERSRSAYTLALIMVVMAMLFATGGLFLSVRSGIDEIVDRQFGADLFIQPNVPDDGEFLRALEAEPDVTRVSPLRFGFTTVVDGRERPEFFVRTIEPESYFAVSSYFWEDGDDASAKAALLEGRKVLVNEDVASTLDVGVGDEITLQTTKGEVDFEVAATFIGAAGPPEITMGLPDARNYLSASRPQGYILNVTEGKDAEVVGKSLERSLDEFSPNTQTAAGQKEEARSQIATYFQIVYAILLIAAIVGLLGLANTLAMSVLHRFREIGILRAIGVTRSQTWRMVLVESATMGLTAFVLSLPLGWLLSFLVIRTVSEGFGFKIPTIYPWTWIPIVFVFGLVIAVVAAIAPGRRAARLHVVNALQYE